MIRVSGFQVPPPLPFFINQWLKFECVMPPAAPTCGAVLLPKPNFDTVTLLAADIGVFKPARSHVPVFINKGRDIGGCEIDVINR